MADIPQKQIFLSYAWANKDVADDIDSDFRKVGITLQRDIRDIKYTDSIKEFMNRVGKSDFVVMLISDDYIRSANCMYEVLELLNSHEFEKRILPVILDHSKVYNTTIQACYYDYWQNLARETKDVLVKHPNEKTINDSRRIESIYQNLGVFFLKVADLKAESYKELKAQNYKPMLRRIGFQEEEILQNVMDVLGIIDNEEQEIAFENLVEQYPENQYVLFYRANKSALNRQFKKARKYYERLIQIHPLTAEAYNNLAIILEQNFGEYNLARDLYESGIEIDPNSAAIQCNLAVLLKNHFHDPHQAKHLLESAINLEPEFTDAIYNLANLQRDTFLDFQLARQYYEKVIEFEPENHMALNNLALLQQNHFKDFALARHYFERATAASPDEFMPYCNFAAFLINHSENDNELATECCETALRLAPNDYFPHFIFGSLLAYRIGDFESAYAEFEKALDLNPMNSDINLHMGHISEYHFKDRSTAKAHYTTALAKNPENEAAKIRLKTLNKERQGKRTEQ